MPLPAVAACAVLLHKEEMQMNFKAGLAAMAILCAAPSQAAPVDIKGRWAI